MGHAPYLYVSMGNNDGATYTISQLAEEFGLTLRGIRFYEHEGMLQPARTGQTRIYSRADQARLVLICRGKRLGFSIAEIKEYLDLYHGERDNADQMRYLLDRARLRMDALKTQAKDVRQSLSELETIEHDILSHLNSQPPETT